jgi:hypothetical protein
MKTPFALLIATLTLICLTNFACSEQDERDIAATSPALAPATRATESVQQTIDPIAHTAQPIATAIGLSGAGTIALVAGAIGAGLGAYNQYRSGTSPLKSAIEQIVQSVEAAFPQKTDQQKAAMAAVQDVATKKLVDGIKAG